MRCEDLERLAARFLVLAGAAVSFGWWQGSVAAGQALGLSLWAAQPMRQERQG